MPKSSIRKYKFIPFLIIVLTFFYNEYLIYWQKLSQCSWKESKNDKLNLMLIADTHLLGSQNGHWFDKLRREWQQHRAFQTARALFKPDYIVIMGDLTDEGKWCSDRYIYILYFCQIYLCKIFNYNKENGFIMKKELKNYFIQMIKQNY
jgi:ethanolamine phosphate phosphodiesterase